MFALQFSWNFNFEKKKIVFLIAFGVLMRWYKKQFLSDGRSGKSSDCKRSRKSVQWKFLWLQTDWLLNYVDMLKINSKPKARSNFSSFQLRNDRRNEKSLKIKQSHIVQYVKTSYEKVREREWFPHRQLKILFTHYRSTSPSFRKMINISESIYFVSSLSMADQLLRII